MRRLGVFAAVGVSSLLLACKGPPPTVAPAGPALRDQLLKQGGASPVYLALVADKGLYARSADGKLDQQLIEATVSTGGVIKEAVLDAPYDLVYLLRGDALEAVDLRVPEGKLTALVRPMPPFASFLVERTAVSEKIEPLTTCAKDFQVGLKWDVQSMVGEVVAHSDDQRRQIAAAQIVGQPWLLAQMGRVSGKGAVEHLDFSSSEAEVVALPPAELKCADARRCGRSLPFGVSGWRLVLVGQQAGDCPHLQCRLYDPRARDGHQFAQPPEHTQWGPLGKTKPGPCGPYHVDRSGKWMLLDDKLCNLDKKDACRSIDAHALGWLSGGSDLY